MSKAEADNLLPWISQAFYFAGTYTPTYEGGTTPGTTTYSLQQGSYIRLWNVVIATLTVVWTNATGTGNAQFSLPIISSATANQNFSGGNRTVNITFANSAPQVLIQPSNSFFILQSPLTNAAATTVAIEAAGNFVGTVIYFVD